MADGGAVAAILVPIDFSGYSGQALLWADALAEAVGVPLLVMHAVLPDELETLSQSGECPADQLIHDTVDRVREFARLWLGDRAARCDARVVVGDPAVSILRVAGEAGCDLIVIAAHDRGAPVTEALLAESRVPLAVLRPETEWPIQPRASVRSHTPGFVH